MSTFTLSDTQWSKIVSFLKTCPDIYTGQQTHLKRFIHAVLSWWVKMMDIPFDFQITELKLKAIRRQVDGITWDEVEEMCAYAEAEGTVAGLRDSALLRLMSDCLLRVSEAVAVNVSDIGKILRVRQSKTDPDGRGVTLYVGTPTLDVIGRYREAGKIRGGALFRRVRYSGISAQGGCLLMERGMRLNGGQSRQGLTVLYRGIH